MTQKLYLNLTQENIKIKAGFKIAHLITPS